jgi:hypothetical protein
LKTNGQSNQSNLEGAVTATATVSVGEPATIVGTDSSAVSTPMDSAPKMSLREWNVSHAYASYYVEPSTDLDAAAEALVRAGVASSVYVADGMAYWMAKEKLEKQRPDLNWREHENHAHLKLPDGIVGWARHGLFKALLHRFSEKKVMSPLPGPQHQYLRAAMEPSSLVFGDEHVIVCPTLKLYKTGVFTISYEVMADTDAIGIPEFVTRYVNLFARWCDEAWVPHAVAKLGAATSLHHDVDSREKREANLGDFMMMRAAAERSAQTVTVGDLEFKMYPAHEPLDDFLLSVLVEAASDPKLRSDLPPKVRDLVALVAQPTTSTAQAPAEPSMSDVPHPSEPPQQTKPAPPVANDVSAEESLATTPDPATTTTNASPSDVSEVKTAGSEEEEPTLTYQLSDMFDNAEFAIRVALDPPPEPKLYVGHGLRPRLTRGDYWNNRPQVSITVFDDQPTTATEVRERFGDQLGLIMLRVPSAPPRVARAHLGESLRPFEDYSLHISQALSLCVYAAERRYRVEPPILETMDRACVFEMIDYLSMRCHQLDERASLAKSVAEARVVRADLGAIENLARTAFRMGELNTAIKAAWQQLELPATVKEAREKVSLASDAASERSNEQGARFNAALAVVFGIVGAAGLTDSFTKPLWTKLGLPLPEGFEGPLCFLISAVFVGLILVFITRLLKRS